MPDTQDGVMLRPLTDVVLPVGENDVKMMFVAKSLPFTRLPLFSKAEADKLDAGTTVTLLDTQGRKWRPLSTWLSDASQAIVLCRKSGLTVRWSAADRDIALLRFAVDDDNQQKLAATLRFTSSTEAIQLVDLDREEGVVQFMLPFEDEAGRALYEKLVVAMDTPGSGVSLEIHYTHMLDMQSDGATESTVEIRPPRYVLGDRLRRIVEALDRSSSVVKPRPDLVRLPSIVDAPLERETTRRLPHGPFKEDPIVRPHRPFRPHRPDEPSTPDEPTTPEPAVRTVERTHRLSLELPQRDHPEVFPDRPRPGADAWGQLERPRGRLLYKQSDAPDVFYYLPTLYKLAFVLDEASGSSLPPMRSVHYRSAVSAEASGEDRVKVTLRAIPFVHDEDREALRLHIQSAVLGHTVPFVRLAPAAGLRAEFVPHFTAGADNLPESVVFRGTAIAADRDLAFEFDMFAWDYGIFCELLRRGLGGRVSLKADDLDAQVDVSLRLDDMTSNALAVSARERTLGAFPVEAHNLLDERIELASLRGFIVDRGKGLVPGIVFAAEGHALSTTPTVLEKKSIAGDVLALPLTPTSLAPDWDDLVIAVGDVRVLGGSAEDWLNRVHADPSLQPAPFTVAVEVLVPATDRIDYVQLTLLRGGAPTTLQTQLRPGMPAWPVTMQLTLAELASAAGRPQPFAIEWYTVYKDEGPGLPQQLVLTRDRDTQVLQALSEAPDCRYTMEWGAGLRESDRDRAATEALIAARRQDGQTWRLFAVKKATPTQPDPVDPVDPVGPVIEPQPTGPGLTVVTSLLPRAFQEYGLVQAFVTLQPDAPDAPATTYRFAPDSQAEVVWRPASGPATPFRYKITYLFAGGAIQQVDGAEHGDLLLLDPPRVP
jgi:hypothetical protein